MKTAREYAARELQILQQRLNAYTEYGYAEELEPIVKILYKAVSDLKNIA